MANGDLLIRVLLVWSAVMVSIVAFMAVFRHLADTY